MDRIRIIDIETTGLDPKHDTVLEIGYLDTFAKRERGLGLTPVANTFDGLIDPEGVPIQLTALAVHHITPRMLHDGPLYMRKDIIASMSDDQDIIYVAHKADFEKSFMPELKQKYWICTYKCAMRAWPKMKSFGNQYLRYALGGYELPIEAPGLVVHRALYDAASTYIILHRLVKEFPLAALLSWSAEPALLPAMPFGKHRGSQWADIPGDYLDWILRASDMSEEVLFATERELKRRRDSQA